MNSVALELVYEVMSPVISPVAARAGDRIVLLLDAESLATVTVWREGHGVVAFEEVEHGTVHGMLLPLAVDGVIIQKTRAAFVQLSSSRLSSA